MVDPESPAEMSQPRSDRVSAATLAVSLLSGLAYALALYLMTRWRAPDSGMLLIGFLLGAPMAASALAVALSDPKVRRTKGSHAATSALTVSIMLVCAAVALREGTVCLVMAAPIFYPTGMLAGVAAGMILKARRGRLMGLSILILPLIGIPIEADQIYPEQNREVVSRVHIDAPPDQVWRYVTEVRSINSREHSWNFSHDVVGIPRPQDARMEGSGVGAARHVTWAKGVNFEERITVWDPSNTLAWTFHIEPKAQSRILDEHLRVDSSYLRLEDGSYDIVPTADGGSELVLTTRYWIRTPMNDYAAFWGRVFLGDFHRNVLGLIKERAEAG